MVDVELPNDFGAPARARARVEELELDAANRHALKLVVSELVTNAVLHGDGPVNLRLNPGEGAVEGEVADAGGGFRTISDDPPDPDDAESGRGLFLVDALCRRWEVDRESSRVSFVFEAAA